MGTTTTPASRFGWQGQTIEYTVKATGADEIVAPSTAEKGLTFRVVDSHRTADGIEAHVAVEVGEGALY